MLVKKCREAQVLLHPWGSAARGCSAPGEAKTHFFGPDLVCLVITENQLQSRPLECCSEAALL